MNPNAILTLLHEVQHEIQQIEGFAEGSNFESGAETSYKVKALDEKMKPLKAERSKILAKYDYEDIAKYDKVYKRYKEITKELRTLQNEKDAAYIEAIKNGTAFERYRRSAGEVEARNVMRRHNFNDEQRQKYLLSDTEDFRHSELLNDNGESYQQIIGIGGARRLDKAEGVTTRMDNLKVARKMERKGTPTKKMWAATGWMRGNDGKWRYEIPDGNIIRTKLDELRKISDDQRKFDELFKENPNYVLNDEEEKRLSELTRIPDAKLPDVFDAPELFAAYPELRNTTVYVEYNLDSSAMFRPDRNTIAIANSNSNFSNRRELRKSLIHEIQHAIQSREGFAEGANYSAKKDTAYNRYYEKFKSIMQELDDETNNKIADILEAERNGYNEIVQAILETLSSEELNAYNDARDALRKAEDRSKHLFSKYMRHSGETEARNAETRAYWGEKRRRNTPLDASEDVSRDEQIVGRLHRKAAQSRQIRRADDTLVSQDDIERFNQLVTNTTPNILIDNRFNLEYMGTGEGSQVEGWGMYFAENPGVTSSYRDEFSYSMYHVTYKGSTYVFNPREATWENDKGETILHSEWDKQKKKYYPVYGENVENDHIIRNRDAVKVFRELIQQMQEWGYTFEDSYNDKYKLYHDYMGDTEYGQRLLNILKGIESVSVETTIPNTYIADIPHNDMLLDWDASMSKQSERVKTAIQELITILGKDKRNSNAVEKLKNAKTGADFYHELEYGVKPLVEKGTLKHPKFGTISRTDMAASLMLNRVGIPGHKYFDGLSRAKQSGTHNFVVWNTDMIKLMGITADSNEEAKRYFRDTMLKKLTGNPNETYNQIIGVEGARLIDRAIGADWLMGNFETAQQMKAKGFKPRTIRRATGWELGHDGKWRYEISDGKLKKGLSLEATVPDIDENWGVFDEVPFGMETQPFAVTTLGKVLDATDLFAAYPQLRDTSVTFVQGEDFEDNGISYPSGSSNVDGSITLTGDFHFDGSYLHPDLNETAILTLLHEVQHNIQRIEGFAGGSNMELAAKNMKAVKEFDKEIEAIQKQLDELYQYNPNLSDRERMLGGSIQSQEYNDLEKKLLALMEERDKLIEKAKDDGTARKRYLRSAGETEARNVMTRHGFSDAQRRNTLLSDTEDFKHNELLDENGETYAQTAGRSAEELLTDGAKIQIEALRTRYKGTDKWLKAPNGHDTNLNELQWLLVRTPNFKEWFGDWERTPDMASKVLDENGEPLVVTHIVRGKGGFSVFNTNGDYSIDWDDKTKGTGAWFADLKGKENKSLETAGIDSVTEGDNIYHVFLNLRNPYIYDAEGKRWQRVGKVWIEDTKTGKLIYHNLDGKAFSNLSWANGFIERHLNHNNREPGRYRVRHETKFQTSDELVRAVREGIVGNGNHDGVIINNLRDMSVWGVDDYIAFKPNSIKSATGNNGAFSTTNDEIYKQTANDELSDNNTARSVDDFLTTEGKKQVEAIRRKYQNTPQWLKAPNGKDTKLTEKQWLSVRTPNFKRWFGDWENNPQNASKVLDKNGEPMVVYHGTNVPVENIREFESGTVGWLGPGIYLTPYTEYATQFSDKGKEGVIPLFLNIKNPLVLNSTWRIGRPYLELLQKLYGDEAERIYKQRYNDVAKRDKDILANIPNEATRRQYIHRRIVTGAEVEQLLAKGYDGINWDDGEYSVIDANRVKSATRNNGDFSTTNDEIYKQIGARRKNEMDVALARNRPDMTQKQRTDAINEIEKLGESVRRGGNPKVEKLATKWLMKGHIILPEDNYKILDAIKISEQYHFDPMQYDDPNEILAKYTIKETKAKRRINPDTVPEFSNKVEYGNGITVYTVDDTEEGQAAVRRIIDTHWGEDANPWCLAARTPFEDTPFAEALRNGDISEEENDEKFGGIDKTLIQAWEYWNNYDSVDKRIAFQNGKLLAFCASDDGDNTWWNREDEPSKGIPYTVKENGATFEYSYNEETALTDNEIYKQTVGQWLRDNVDNIEDKAAVWLESRGLENLLGITRTQLKNVAKKYRNTPQWMRGPNGKYTNLTEKQWLQVRTPNFKQWFGDWENDPANASKILDENGEPLVVYRGVPKNINTLSPVLKSNNPKRRGIFFSSNNEAARSYTYKTGDSLLDQNDDKIYAVFLNIRNPYTIEGNGHNWDALEQSISVADASGNIIQDGFASSEEAQEFIDDTLIGEEMLQEEKELLNIVNAHYNPATGEVEEPKRPLSKAESERLEVIKNIRDSYSVIENKKKTDEIVEEVLEGKRSDGANAYDGVVFHDIYDVVVIPTFTKDPVSDVHVAFKPNQIKSATRNNGDFSTTNDEIYKQTRTQETQETANTSYLAKYSNILNSANPETINPDNLSVDNDGFITPDILERYNQSYNLNVDTYHGTGHIILNNAFALSKSGSGEGGQYRGYGIYTAQAKGVAETYRKFGLDPDKMIISVSASDGTSFSLNGYWSSLTEELYNIYNESNIEDDLLEDIDGDAPAREYEKRYQEKLEEYQKNLVSKNFDAEKMLYSLWEYYERMTYDLSKTIKEKKATLASVKSDEEKSKLNSQLLQLQQSLDSLESELDSINSFYDEDSGELKKSGVDITFGDANHGNIYNAAVASDNVRLDWDALLTEQPEHVVKAINKIKNFIHRWSKITGFDTTKFDASDTGGSLYMNIVNIMRQYLSKHTPKDKISNSKQRTSLLFNRFGVPGLRFLDRFSRRDLGQQGTYNYVTWNEDAMRITNIDSDSDKEAINYFHNYKAEHPEIYNQFISVKATERLADAGLIAHSFGNKQTLETAKALDAKHMPASFIWRMTGWFKGKDGNWKTEIPDGELRDKFMRDSKQRTVTLYDAYDNDVLYAAYPFLKDMPLHVKKLKDGVGGFYDPVNREITLDTQSIKDLDYEVTRSNLIHEIQHAIQDFSGWDGGSTIGEEGFALKKRIDHLLKSQKGTNGVYLTLALDYLSRNDAVQAHYVAQNLDDKGKKAWGKIVDTYTKLMEVFENYKRSAGETEARNAEKRSGFTLEKRRNTPPTLSEDYGRSKQILNTQGSIVSERYNQVIGEKGGKAIDETNGNRKMMNSLQMAKKMKDKGVKPRTIKRATGWELGTEGKWKYEIQEGQLLNPEGKEYLSLRDFYDNQTLFAAYPSLNEINVAFDIEDDMHESPAFNETPIGYFDKDTLTFHIQRNYKNHLKYINNGLPETDYRYGEVQELKSWLVGQIQKLIQSRENFAMERSVDWFSDSSRPVQRVDDNGRLYWTAVNENPETAAKHSAGNIEVKNVQARMDLSPELRRDILMSDTEPVAKNEQIVSNWSVKSENYRADEYGNALLDADDNLPDSETYNQTVQRENNDTAVRSIDDFLTPEAKRQMEAVRKQYEGTAQWLKAPNGEKLSTNHEIKSYIKTLHDNPLVERYPYDIYKQSATDKDIDRKYFDALNAGDMDTARAIVNEQARRKGYYPDNQHRGTHQPPNSHDGYPNLANIMTSDLVPADYWTHPEYYLYSPEEWDAYRSVVYAIKNKKLITVYRAVPIDVKETALRNGDWVTPSRDYAVQHGESSLDGSYRIISAKVNPRFLWWNADSIAELGYDNGNNYAYKNTKNGRKLNDTVVHGNTNPIFKKDETGNYVKDEGGHFIMEKGPEEFIVPPSKRFNSRKSEEYFQAVNIHNNPLIERYPQAMQAHSFDNPDTERSYRKHQKVSRQGGTLHNIRQSMKEFLKGFRGDFPLLAGKEAREKGLIPAREYLRFMNRSLEAKTHMAMVQLYDNLHGLNAEQFDIFSRVMLLNDLRVLEANYKDKDGNPLTELPFGFTHETLEAEYEDFSALVQEDEAIDKAIKREYENNVKARQTLADTAAKFGMKSLARRISSNDLFLIRYAGLLGENGDISEDISSNYIVAMGDMRAMLLQDTERLHTLGKIYKKYDKKNELVRQYGNEWRKHIPKGYSTFNPFSGQFIEFAHSLDEKVLDAAFENLCEELGIPEEHINTFRATLAYKNTADMVLPDEIVKTLKKMSEPNPRSPLVKFAKALTSPWKKYVLYAPTRVWKYNLRNITGDLDAALARDPTCIRYLPKAIKELFIAYYGDPSKVSKELKEFQARGGALTFEAAQFFGDEKQLKEFNELIKEIDAKGDAAWKKIPRGAWKVFDFLWSGVQKASDFREQWLRYAVYLDYLHQMQEDSDGMPRNWGASVKEEVLALDDIRDRAFKMANELLGAYDQVSEAGKQLRDVLMPFYSWMEVNAKRYIQLIKNGFGEDDFLIKRLPKTLWTKAPFLAYKAAKTYLFINLFSMLLHYFNTIFFPEDEKKLPPDIQGRPHITLGHDKDGNTLYFSQVGALFDNLEWFGIDNVEWAYGVWFPHDVKRILNGQMTVTDWINNIISAPAGKILNAITPLNKTPYELAFGKSSYPSPSEGRPIKDKLQYFAQFFALNWPYRALTDKYVDNWKEFRNLFIYSQDADRAASFYIGDLADQYNEKVLGKGKNTYTANPILSQLKQALRHHDKENVIYYLNEYYRTGGKKQGVSASLRTLHPLHSIVKDKQEDFRKWLSDDDREFLKRAEAYYDSLMDFYNEATEGYVHPDGKVGSARQKNTRQNTSKQQGNKQTPKTTQPAQRQTPKRQEQVIVLDDDELLRSTGL